MMIKNILCATLLFLFYGGTARSQWQMMSSTPKERWTSTPMLAAETYSASNSCDIVVDSRQIRQHFDGWGGCFNELGWKALQTLDSSKRAQIIADLYGYDDGLKFTYGRIPVAADDYALNWYSYDEAPGDFSMSKFSIGRDKELLIPYIQAALRINPSIKFWASPWSPPSWMKVNQHYACLPNKFNDLPENRSVKSLKDQFILKPEYLKAYALYLSKFVQAYKKEGINIQALHVQNEPFHYATFPGCVWTAKSLGNFIGDYLSPEFKERSLKTEIWYGTINNGSMEGFEDALNNPRAQSVIKGIGIQWAGKNALPQLKRKFPKYTMMQTESECGNGSFDWIAAEHTFELIKFYIDNGVNSYMYWNMVLDDSGQSSWGWKQNALITIKTSSGKIMYTPEYYLFKHLSSFVGPGSYNITQEGPFNQALVFKNQNGKIVIFIHNPFDYAKNITVKIDNEIVHVPLQPKSFNTLFK